MVSLQENSWEEGICPICQESPTEAVSTDCGHVFCRVCLAQHVDKASASGVFCCPLCRKPCSEGVLGAGHICHSHQKRVRWFCEESRLLLCVECLVSPEHKSHCELAIENAISHYKAESQLGAPPEDVPGEVCRAAAQLSSLVSDLERTARDLGASTLKYASDLMISRPWVHRLMRGEAASAPVEPAGLLKEHSEPLQHCL
ncbi:tripartite motif-containing protein 40 [Molossus molossus]|uniref:tripartite motif-containing protein 40 n=1 Tax=Molossus molossus TaxID=27622 RepID=UPI00174635BC|nr:tripartite motif-containing protein 40 [Molossus molossus]